MSVCVASHTCRFAGLLSQPFLLTLGLMNAQAAATETLATHVAGVDLGAPTALEGTPRGRLGLGCDSPCQWAICTAANIPCWCCSGLLLHGRTVTLLQAAAEVACCSALALRHLHMTAVTDPQQACLARPVRLDKIWWCWARVWCGPAIPDSLLDNGVHVSSFELHATQCD